MASISNIIVCVLFMSITTCLPSPSKSDRGVRRVVNKPSCSATATDIEGPYYKANAPFHPADRDVTSYICRHSPAYDRIYLNGTIKLQKGPGDCGAPVKALLDIWHANADGVYSDSNPGSKDYNCRNRVYTQVDGSYSLSSIFPGRYDDGGYRPAHIHFKITPVDKFDKPIGKIFTTQLYFAEDYYLSPRDSCGHCSSGQSSLISHVQHVSDIKTYIGTWDVILPSLTNQNSRLSSATEESRNTRYWNSA